MAGVGVASSASFSLRNPFPRPVCRGDSGPRPPPLRRQELRPPIAHTLRLQGLTARSGWRSDGFRANSHPVDSPSSDEEAVGTDADDGNTGSCQPNTGAETSAFPNKDINRRISVASALGAVGLFASSRLNFGVSLKDLSVAAVPYEQALTNGKPTVVEFYADWCEVCRELAPDVYKVEQQYKDLVNFVMLNVDNTKWEQELDEFGVEGIPHFAFLDKSGNEEGNVVGRLPRKYLFENVAALANGESSVPHSRVVGRYSSAESRKVHQVVDPRSHG